MMNHGPWCIMDDIKSQSLKETQAYICTCAGANQVGLGEGVDGFAELGELPGHICGLKRLLHSNKDGESSKCAIRMQLHRYELQPNIFADFLGLIMHQKN